MIKKLAVFALLGLPFQLMAFSMQGDVSYFRPSSSVLREIYGKGWIDYKVEMGGTLSKEHWFWKKISLFGDISYLEKEGHSLGGYAKTEIRIIPVSLGLKWVEPISDSVDFYLGAAPRYFFLNIHDHFKGIRQKTHRNGLGAMAITGLTFDLWKGLYLDLFGSYSFKHFDKPSTSKQVKGHSLHIGGLDVGGGLGWEF